MFLQTPAQNPVYQAFAQGECLKDAARLHPDAIQEALSYFVSDNQAQGVEELIEHAPIHMVRRAAWWIGEQTAPSIVQMLVARVGSAHAPWVLAHVSRKGRSRQFDVVKEAMAGQSPQQYRHALHTAIIGDNTKAVDEVIDLVDRPYCHEQFVEASIYGRLKMLHHMIPWLSQDPEFSDSAQKSMQHLATLNVLLRQLGEEELGAYMLELCPFLSSPQIAQVCQYVDQGRTYSLLGASADMHKQKAKDRVLHAWATWQRMELSQQVKQSDNTLLTNKRM